MCVTCPHSEHTGWGRWCRLMLSAGRETACTGTGQTYCQQMATALPGAAHTHTHTHTNDWQISITASVCACVLPPSVGYFSCHYQCNTQPPDLLGHTTHTCLVPIMHLYSCTLLSYRVTYLWWNMSNCIRGIVIKTIMTSTNAFTYNQIYWRKKKAFNE